MDPLRDQLNVIRFLEKYGTVCWYHAFTHSQAETRKHSLTYRTSPRAVNFGSVKLRVMHSQLKKAIPR